MLDRGNGILITSGFGCPDIAGFAVRMSRNVQGLWTWGWNDYGKLGKGNRLRIRLPW